MDVFKNELINYVNELYGELDYSIPYDLEWKERDDTEYLMFSIKSGRSYEINDHDRVVTKIINGKYSSSISEVYTIDTGRYYQIWCYGKVKLRKMKINSILNG